MREGDRLNRESEVGILRGGWDAYTCALTLAAILVTAAMGFMIWKGFQAMQM